MKIFVRLPWGSIEIEREPWSKEKFYMVWGCVTACVLVLGFFSVVIWGMKI